jgi:hypothetical protein
MNTFELFTAASAASQRRRGGPHYPSSRNRHARASEFNDDSSSHTQFTVAIAGNTRKVKAHTVATPTTGELQVWRPENALLTKRRSSLYDETCQLH